MVVRRLAVLRGDLQWLLGVMRKLLLLSLRRRLVRDG
jgi:hypothetical protein